MTERDEIARIIDPYAFTPDGDAGGGDLDHDHPKGIAVVRDERRQARARALAKADAILSRRPEGVAEPVALTDLERELMGLVSRWRLEASVWADEPIRMNLLSRVASELGTAIEPSIEAKLAARAEGRMIDAASEARQ